MDENRVKEFIYKLSLRNPEEISPETPLLSSGTIDSSSLLELVSFVEKQYGIKIRPRDMSLKNFDSITRILAFVKGQNK